MCLGRPPGVRFPAGRDGAEPGEQLARSMRARRGNWASRASLLDPCSGSRPWSWSRWAFDLLGKGAPKSLIV